MTGAEPLSDPEPIRRVLHIIPSVRKAYGGPVATLIGMLEMWRRIGLVADVATCDYLDTPVDDIKARRLYRFQRTFPKRFSRSRVFNAWLRRCARDYDLVFVHTVWNFFAVESCYTLRRLHVPYLLVPHGSLDPHDLRKKAFLKRLAGPMVVRPLAAAAIAILCSTQREAEHLVTYGSQRWPKVLAWPSVFTPLAPTGAFRRRIGVPEGEFIFLFLSRIDMKKGLDVLIPAFGRVLRSGRRGKLVIAGSGSPTAEGWLRDLVADSGCKDHVILTGFLEGDEKKAAFAESDCFLLPSRNENFGHAVVEALASGTPVIISPGVYIADVILEHDCGWVCAQQVDELEKTMKAILDSPAELERKRRGAKQAAARFTAANLMRGYTLLVDDLSRETRRMRAAIGTGLVANSPGRLSILHVQGLFAPEHGGPAYSLANMCVEQARLGHQVTVRVLSGQPFVSRPRQLPEPIDQRSCVIVPPAKLGLSFELRAALARDRSPDLYHLHGSWLLSTTFGAQEAKRRRRPYLIEMMGSYMDYELERKWIRKEIARRLYQDRVLHEADCIHVNSREEGRTLQRHGFTRPIVCLPVGVDLNALRRTLANTATMGRIRARPYVLYLSRVHWTKGIEPLLAAWEAFWPTKRDWQLIIAGTGHPDYVAKCREQSAEMVARGACEWLGQVTEEDKVRLYRDAAVYVMPSFGENFGNTVAEALACRTPVITTRDTHWTMIEERQCGWLAQAEPSSLRRAFERCEEVGDAERRRRGALGHDMIESEYSIESVVASLTEVYRGVLFGKLPDRLRV